MGLPRHSRDGELGVETWQDGAHRYTGNANVWSMMSGDDELGLVYLPTTTPNSDYYGGFRKGDGCLPNLVAVNVETGSAPGTSRPCITACGITTCPPRRRCSTSPCDGRRIKALAQVSKQAFTYVFDRVTGKPVWPIEERPVPPSDIPGEELSKTQPFPTRPPAFDQQGITETI